MTGQLGIDPWNQLYTVGCMSTTAAGPIVPPMPLTRRSGRWPTVLAAFLKANRLCEGCGRTATTAHHKQPVALCPDLELDPANLVAVCVACHFVACHCGRWDTYDPDPIAALSAHRERVRRAKRI